MYRPVRRTTPHITVVSLLVLAGGCGLLRAPDPPPDRSQDARILSEVESRLALEPELDSARIRVEVDAAIVLLYGSVTGLDAWQCAQRNAQLVEGVRSVVDYLIIERGPREMRCLAPRTTPGRIVSPSGEPPD